MDIREISYEEGCKLFGTQEYSSGKGIDSRSWAIYCEQNTDEQFIEKVKALFLQIDPETLEGLEAVIQMLLVNGVATVHGVGCRIAPGLKDGRFDDRGWLSITAYWSGDYKIGLVQGTSPYGFGAEGLRCAEIVLREGYDDLSCPYEIAKKMIAAPGKLV